MFRTQVIAVKPLLAELRQITENNISMAEQQLAALPLAQFTYAPDSKKWSIAQVLAHLNVYGEYYLPVMQKAARECHVHIELTDITTYQPFWLGKIFAQSMKKMNGNSPKFRMNTFKKYDPAFFTFDETKVLDVFVSQQRQLLEIFLQAESIDLSVPRIHISLSKYIKINLGDALQFVIYHNERHLKQVLKILNTF